MAKAKGLSIPELEKQVAEQVIDMMKKHGLEWTMHWQRPRAACNGVTGHTYTGSNVLTTWLWLMLNGHDDPRFISKSYLFPRRGTGSYRGGEGPIGKLRKGEKGIPIMFYSTMEKEDENGVVEQRRIARLHWVWHVSQIDDLDESRLVDATHDAAPEKEIERDAATDAWIAETRAKIRHAGYQPCYVPATDAIVMPPMNTFYTKEGYYGVLLHELTHWTGAKHRLDRICHTEKGDDDYAFEELVAELGSVMLGTQLGVQIGPREDNAAYLKSWMKKLGSEPRYIFDAARKASAAARFLNDLQPAEPEKEAA